MRCLIAGRPPVTNMYESIIWVSFAVSFFGMIFFARYRTPVYLLAALPVSLVALLLVHQMPIAMPSSIDPLVPVLRDNFWLTIHVLTITLSYAAFALAMGFGHILLFRYARNPVAARADQPMHFWLYRVLQLGVILLAAGTILGGVWANYSWGRFWGWDPKETWALIALLCYILTLHGRLAGWWTQFGLVVASVGLFSGGLDGVVWREFRPRQRIAQLWVRPRRRNLCRQFRRRSICCSSRLRSGDIAERADARPPSSPAVVTSESVAALGGDDGGVISRCRFKQNDDPAERECGRNDSAMPLLSQSGNGFRQRISTRSRSSGRPTRISKAAQEEFDQAVESCAAPE